MGERLGTEDAVEQDEMGERLGPKDTVEQIHLSLHVIFVMKKGYFVSIVPRQQARLVFVVTSKNIEQETDQTGWRSCWWSRLELYHKQRFKTSC